MSNRDILSLQGLLEFFKAEAKAGHYHNPYDVSDEVEKRALAEGKSKYDAEELGQKTGDLFWSM